MTRLKNYASHQLISPSLKKTLLIVIAAYGLSLIIAGYTQKIAHQYTTQALVNSPLHGTITNTGSVRRTTETTPNITMTASLAPSHAGQVMRNQTHQNPSSCLDNDCPTSNASNPMTKMTSPDTPLIIHKTNDPRVEKTEFALLAQHTKQPTVSIKKSHSAPREKSKLASSQNPPLSITATSWIMPTLSHPANPSVLKTLSHTSLGKQPATITQPPIPLISEYELEQLLIDFQTAYSQGDLALLFDLFAQNIRSNTTNDQRTVKNSYKKLFDITQTRRMILEDMHWQQHSTNALGKGTFKLILQEKGRSVSQSLSGDITLDVEKKSPELMITQIQYNYN